MSPEDVFRSSRLCGISFIVNKSAPTIVTTVQDMWSNELVSEFISVNVHFNSAITYKQTNCAAQSKET
jgi:hypothetical protein